MADKAHSGTIVQSLRLYKMQLDSVGDTVMGYRKEFTHVFEAHGTDAQRIAELLHMHPLSKVYVMARVDPSGMLHIDPESKLPEDQWPDW